MGGNNSTPCSSGGSTFCEHVEKAVSCQNGSDYFWCSCQSGYEPDGQNTKATCKDIDECARGLDNCQQKGSDCVNTPGSYECGCGTYREEKGGTCVDINECATDRGGCDENSDCINQDGARQLCRCHKGWTGNNEEPGVACKDINECNENPSICPSNAVCTNLPGSYKCECGAGYEPDSSGSGCVTEDFCGTGKNACDTKFATCSLIPGSFKCECISGFYGAGTVNTCELFVIFLVSGGILWCLYKRFIRKDLHEEEDELWGNQGPTVRRKELTPNDPAYV
ncbi:microneme protein [Cyclospora cayetanensis]|uniref:Microneme protein n=1 Tax=Cyclospora cayetanensis TaxID=88456 RepID=A0A1D3D043_9EIME|nr:microneme protein [Cyclospora cayetanensis]